MPLNFDDADAINQAVRALCLRSRARAAALLDDVGLFPGQEVLLLELAKGGPVHQALLGERLGCEPPSVTLMAQKLEARGLIARRPSPTDRRAVVVELTPAGRELVGAVRERWRTLAQETVSKVDEAVVPGLAQVLARMAAGLARDAD